MFRILMHVQDETPSTYYRTVLPYKFCRGPLRDRGIELILSQTVNLDDRHDAYYFQRSLNPKFLPVVRKLQEDGSLVIFDTDDDLENIPEWSPVRKSVGPLERLCMRMAFQWADQITVTTEALKAVVGHEAKTAVLPNLLDAECYPSKELVPYRPDEGKFRILWAGSATHTRDIEQTFEAMDAILDDHREDVQFIWIGCDHEIFKAYAPEDVLVLGGCPIRYYPSMLTTLNPHLALLPLAEHPFNESKSAIKYCEMTLAGAPCISNQIGPYFATKTLQAITAGDWTERIAACIENTDLRRLYHHEALCDVMSHHVWSSPASQQWIDFFASLKD